MILTRPVQTPARTRGARRALAVLGFGAAALTGVACASTEDESARIGRESQLAAAQTAKKSHAPRHARPHRSRRSSHRHAAGPSG